MSGAWIRVATADATADLYPGCIIGRSWRCDLVINDPRVSEVHAVVSLRSGSLKLRRLGGNLWLYGMPVEAAILCQGQRIALAEDIEIRIDDIMLPETVPALRIGGGEPTPLEGTRLWVDANGVHSRPVDGGVELWAIDEDWYAGRPGQPLIGPVQIGELQLELVQLERQQAESPATRARGLYAPLHIVARYDTVQLRQANHPVLVLSGLPARLLTELAELQAPVNWKVAASELWPKQPTDVLRRRWDKTLASLRGKLREARIRPDLVRSSGGQVSLVLVQGDVLEVES